MWWRDRGGGGAEVGWAEVGWNGGACMCSCLCGLCEREAGVRDAAWCSTAQLGWAGSMETQAHVSLCEARELLPLHSRGQQRPSPPSL